MKTKIFQIPFLLLACAAVNVTHAIEPDGIDSNAAFARLKALVGEWRAETGMGKAHVAYELIAGGNPLLERETIEKMPPMLTVYHLDGGSSYIDPLLYAGQSTAHAGAGI